VKGLTEEQLNEVFTRVITAADPNVSKTTVKFHFKEGVYKVDPTVSHLAVHFCMEGNLMHVDSAEAKELEPVTSAKPKDALSAAQAAMNAAVEKVSSSAQAGEPKMSLPKTTDSGTGTGPTSGKKLLKNQFNYTERAMQCTGNAKRDLSMSTEPPVTVDHSGFVSQWKIFDAYLQDLNEQLQQRGQSARKAEEQSKETVSEKASPEVLADADEEDESVLAANAALDAATEAVEAEAGHKGPHRDGDSIFYSAQMARALTIVERALVGNWDADTYHTYRYVDDVSPAQPAPNGIAAGLHAATSAPEPDARVATTPTDLGVLPAEARGRVTPLWRLHNEALSQKQTVTAVSWNPQHPDLVAVAYGSYDFVTSHKLAAGHLHCYSLKNPTHPEASFALPSAVASIAWHPTLPSLLAVGLYSGMVCVVDASRSGSAPIYMANEPGIKHTGPVWEVQWPAPEPVNHIPVAEPAAGARTGGAAQPVVADVSSEKLTFSSVSADGHVAQWAVNQNFLERSDLVRLTIVDHQQLCQQQCPDKARLASREDAHTGDDKSTLVTRYAGTCFSFNTSAPLLVVGTEEGHLLTYDTAHNATLLQTYESHTMAVYRVQWNPFHPNVFISCSADWTVKMWDHRTFAPVATLDMHTAVGDVMWAPFKATVFGCVTTDGWLRLYDLKASKIDPIGEHRVTRSATKLTHLAFNPRDPVLAVGDDKGVATIFKLNSKLCKLNAPSIDDIDPVQEQQILAELIVAKDEHGKNKTISFIPPKYQKSQKKLQEEARLAAAALAAASKKSKSHEDDE
jgi:dynein intermediate chain 1